MATGVFSLRKVYIKQYQNVDNRNFASWPESAIYGYYGGGSPSGPNYLSNISRIDFSNEVVTSSTNNLPQERYAMAGTSSSLYGYFGGGLYFNVSPFHYNTIVRLDFSNNVVSLPGKNMFSSLGHLSATSSGFYGYFGGGYFSPPATFYNTISRLDFSNETVSQPGNHLLSLRSKLSTTSNNSYGYFGGGTTPSIACIITRLDFSNETVSNPGNNLSSVRNELSAVSSSAYGYFVGGLTPTATCTISRLDFSNETVSNPAKNLPTVRSGNGATSSSFYGYFGGGGIPGISCTISRLDFSTETASDPGKNLPVSGSYVAGLSGGQSIDRGFKTYGYITGGNVPGGTNTQNVRKFDYSTGSLTTLPLSNQMPAISPTPAGTGRVDHFGISTNYFGYFSGGSISGLPGNVNRVSRLDFSNETWNDPGKDLPTTRYNHTGFSAPHNYDRGYFATGITFVFPNPIGPTYISTVTRIQYSSETVSNPGINSPFVAFSASSVKTDSYGYFTGGATPPSNPVPTQGLLYSNVARLDFSTENISLPVNLPGGRSGSSMFSFYNKSYGYFCGGFSPPPTASCRIERLDFSNETMSNRTNMPSTFSSFDGQTTNSQFYGFTFGGSVGTSFQTTIYRFDFSSESFALYSFISPGISAAAAVSNGI